MYLIALDLDGTLIGKDHVVSARTRTALASAAAKGHQIVAVTGRSRLTAMNVVGDIDCISRIVSSNGAYHYCKTTDNVLHEQAIAPQDWHQWTATIRNVVEDVCFGWETTGGLAYDREFIVAAGKTGGLEQGGDSMLDPNQPLSNVDLYKLFVRSTSVHRDDVYTQVCEQLSIHAEITTSGAPFIELTAKGATKATGLARVAEELGILAQQTYAFGDNHNDVPMLRWAHHSYAMGNAPDAVKQEARHVTLTNEEDGVAAVLEGLIA